MVGKVLDLRLDVLGMWLYQVIAATLFVLQFTMEGQREENQDCDEAVDSYPKDGHRSPPNLSAMAGDYLYDTPIPPR